MSDVLHQKTRELSQTATAVPEKWRVTVRKAADAIAYTVFNAFGRKLDDLDPRIVDSTAPFETALIAERELRALLSTTQEPHLIHVQDAIHGVVAVNKVYPGDVIAKEYTVQEPPVAQVEATHPDDAAVDRFAAEMKAKLAAARAKGRGGWDGPECNADTLSRMLRDHVAKGDPRDVANFCMFLHQRGEAIQPETTQQPVSADPPIPEGFTPWPGGECPKDARDRDVTCMVRDGTIATASQWRWSHNGSIDDIIGYRVEQPATVKESLTIAQPEATEGASDPNSIGYEVRRWCSGDHAWTEWQSCTEEYYQARKLDDSLQFRKSHAQPAAVKFCLSADTGVEALASEIKPPTTYADGSCDWIMSAAHLREFARRLTTSDAQPMIDETMAARGEAARVKYMEKEANRIGAMKAGITAALNPEQTNE